MCALHIQWLDLNKYDSIGIARMGVTFERPPDKYDLSMVVLVIGDEAEIIGASGGMGGLLIQARDEVLSLLRDIGVMSVKWERHRADGSVKRITKRLL